MVAPPTPRISSSSRAEQPGLENSPLVGKISTMDFLGTLPSIEVKPVGEGGGAPNITSAASSSVVSPQAHDDGVKGRKERSGTDGCDNVDDDGELSARSLSLSFKSRIGDGRASLNTYWSNNLPIPRLGVLCLFLSGTVFSIQTLFAKKTVPYISALEISFFRGLISWMFIVLYVASRKDRNNIQTWIGTPDYRPWIVLRGFVGYFANLLLFCSLEGLPLGDANIIFFSAPIWSSIFAIVLLGERTSLITAVVIFCCLTGVVLTARPWEKPEQDRTQTGLFLAFLGSIVSGLVFVVLRALKGLPWYTVMVTQFTFQTIIGLPFAYFIGWLGNYGTVVFDFGWDVGRNIITIGCLAFVGQIFMTLGSQMEKASVSSAARTIDIPLAILFQVTFFAQPIHLASAIGACLIVAAVMVLTFTKDDAVVHVAPSEGHEAGSKPAKIVSLVFEESCMCKKTRISNTRVLLKAPLLEREIKRESILWCPE